MGWGLWSPVDEVEVPYCNLGLTLRRDAKEENREISGSLQGRHGLLLPFQRKSAPVQIRRATGGTIDECSASASWCCHLCEGLLYFLRKLPDVVTHVALTGRIVSLIGIHIAR